MYSQAGWVAEGPCGKDLRGTLCVVGIVVVVVVMLMVVVMVVVDMVPYTPL